LRKIVVPAGIEYSASVLPKAPDTGKRAMLTYNDLIGY